MDKQQQQHQILMKYIEGIVNDKSTTTSDVEGSSSNSKSGVKMEEKDATNNDSATSSRKREKMNKNIMPIEANLKKLKCQY